MTRPVPLGAPVHRLTSPSVAVRLVAIIVGLALGLVGLALAAVYYLHFAPMVWQQVPRLLEGGGQGRGASRSGWDAARLQGLGALGQWGWPAIVLALVGRCSGLEGRCRRALAGYWLAGLALTNVSG